MTLLSWVVLRSQIKESKRAQSSVSGLRAGDAVGRKGPDFPVEEWCDDANDWGQRSVMVGYTSVRSCE